MGERIKRVSTKYLMQHGTLHSILGREDEGFWRQSEQPFFGNVKIKTDSLVKLLKFTLDLRQCCLKKCWPVLTLADWDMEWTGIRLTASSSKLWSLDIVFGIITPVKNDVLQETLCWRVNVRWTPVKPSLSSLDSQSLQGTAWQADNTKLDSIRLLFSQGCPGRQNSCKCLCFS